VTVAIAEPGGTVPNMERVTRFLQPGQLIVSFEPATITTILGSCVSVCLWDPRTSIGGMNHFMLPIPVAGHAASPRFGDFAMQQLVDRMEAAGARMRSVRAKVFGGASMFPIVDDRREGRTHLGAQNADLAIQFLKNAGIPVVERDLGGTRGRKLIFQTDEGTSCLKLI